MPRWGCVWFCLSVGCAGARTAPDMTGVSRDARSGAGVDAALDASIDASLDAGEMSHACYVYDDCNGGTNNDYSATGCPTVEPAIGSACTLAFHWCFYCPPGQDAWHWWQTIPNYQCRDGRRSFSYLNYACE